MELFVTPDNPMPANAIVSAVRTRDGLTLRVARWSADHARGTILVAMGRSEFIEQYYEVVTLLLGRGFDVVVFDWRGQGQSDREIKARRRGYVSDFAGYRRDLVAVEAQILRPFARTPWFGLGHSMGAAVLIDQAHDGRSPFERLVLSAPMIGITLRHPTAVRLALRILDRLGFGAMMIPGGSEGSVFERPFADNILTGDPRQYRRLGQSIATLPALAVGAPTIRWAARAFVLIERFEGPRYAVRTLTPMLIVAAGADRIVDTAATERFALGLKAGRCIVLPGARHQLMMDRKEIADQFWAAFDTFVPGENAPAVPPADDSWATVIRQKTPRGRLRWAGMRVPFMRVPFMRVPFMRVPVSRV